MIAQLNAVCHYTVIYGIAQYISVGKCLSACKQTAAHLRYSVERKAVSGKLHHPVFHGSISLHGLGAHF